MTKKLGQINWREDQFTFSSKKYYLFVISKPKRFAWLRRLFKLNDCYVETMFSDNKAPIMPKGFTKYKLIGEVRNAGK